MKIISLLPILSYGDAVGNDALAIHRSLKRAGFDCLIAAINVDTRIPAEDQVMSIKNLDFVNTDDIVIYHLATGSIFNDLFTKIKCKKKIIRYHNITPPHFFSGYNHNMVINCIEAYRETTRLAKYCDICIADSPYNQSELRRMGYTCPIEVIPILISFEDYKKTPSNDMLEKYKNDDHINFLFTGRIVPNKRQEDIISVFSEYQKVYNKKSRLFLVGKYEGLEPYYQKLLQHIEKLQVQNVVLTGHIAFSEILAYYHLADLFLCMSDHEGFCVPLLEAMYFNIPIVAKNTTAIESTINGGGILLNKEDSIAEFSGMCNRILSDESLRKNVLAGQRCALDKYNFANVEKMILEFMQKIL